MAIWGNTKHIGYRYVKFLKDNEMKRLHDRVKRRRQKGLDNAYIRDNTPFLTLWW